MQSFDKTMLSKLGFDDPDKKDRRHDWACQYVAQQVVAEVIGGVVFRNRLARGKSCRAILDEYQSGSHAAGVHLLTFLAENKWDSGFSSLGFSKSNVERHLQKGQGQYATTIGFLDAVLNFRASFVVCSHKTHRPPPFAKPEDWDISLSSAAAHVLVEVKINPVDVGAIIRQLSLYMDYWQTGDSARAAVVACAFPLQVEDVSTLAGEGITYMPLSNKFDEYVKRRETAPQADLPGL